LLGTLATIPAAIFRSQDGHSTRGAPPVCLLYQVIGSAIQRGYVRRVRNTSPNVITLFAL
jgi:hypothetical protein